MATETKPKVVIEVRGLHASWWLRIKVLDHWWKPTWKGDDAPQSRVVARECAARLATAAEAQGFDVEVRDG